MKAFRWDPVKSGRLKKTRGVSFEEIINSTLVDVRSHPKRPGQNLMLFERKGYIWVVPFIENENDLFLKNAVSQPEVYESL